ncbi:uncharacterized protein [Nicotiana sylvestris]|uniref:uncharacterized protein n=1 Tax=Nicotiana sylvestris TaxID=4096 RepID=UPI00388CBC53
MQLEAEKELQVFNGSNPRVWTLFTDGSSNVNGEGLGIVLVPPMGETIRQAIKCHSITNNEAEYEVVIASLELARELGINQIYGIIPKDKKKTYALRKKAARYCLKQGNLYRKMFGGPLTRCLGPSQTEYVMREIHEGHCGNHAGGRSLVRTMIRAGYYWPKMEAEAETFVAKCDKCQRYGNNMHRPVELLHPIIALWPFMKWGMDIVGPLPQAKGKVKFLLVLTDYITKWVEAGAFKQNKRIISTPYHPMGNGQAESTNKVIVNNLKKRLEESKVEIGEPSMRYTQASEESNEEEMRINLDLLEGKREAVLIRTEAQKQVLERYYNRKARLRYFKIGDFVLKKVFQSAKAANTGKLSLSWEGPYKIHGIAGKGAYELETMDDKILPSHWNVVHLKRYYF